jgi:GNAT superfamily N-acetyltransferase
VNGLLTIGEQATRILSGAGRVVANFDADDLIDTLGIRRRARPDTPYPGLHTTDTALIQVEAKKGKVTARAPWPAVDSWTETTRMITGGRPVDTGARMLGLEPQTYTLDDFYLDDDSSARSLMGFKPLTAGTAPLTDSPGQRFVTAHLAATGEPVAWGGIYWTSKAARMKALFCRPEWRGVGIGNAVTERVFDLAKAERRVVEAFAIDDRWYLARGFQVEGERANGATVVRWRR